MKDIVIIGAGGFARETKSLIDSINAVTKEWNFLGYIDDCVYEDDVIGNDDFLLNYEGAVDAVIAIGNPEIRDKAAKKYLKQRNISFPIIMAPTAEMSDSVKMGKGNIICAKSILTVNINVGDFNIINLSCTVGHESIIKDYVTINPGTNISGNVLIELFTEIGTGTRVIQGVSIGRRTIIGAGAVVNRPLPGNCTAVGVPAKIIRKR